METVFFLHQVKHTAGEFTKGIVVKNTYQEALQSYHAYLGAYAYGQDVNTDYVSCMITGVNGNVMDHETWIKGVVG